MTTRQAGPRVCRSGTIFTYKFPLEKQVLSSNSGTATADKDVKDRQKQPLRPRDALTREDCLELFQQLFLARYFDVRLIKEKNKGRLSGTLYSSHNQEAIIVGSLFGLRPNDW